MSKQQTIATRASSRERDEAIQHLQTAFSDGRLTEHEFDERMTAALNSKTIAELDALLVDLGHTRAATTHSSSTLDKPTGSVTLAIMGGVERGAHWIVPQHHSIVAIMGGCELDLRQAQFTSHITTLNVVAIMGGVEIKVPPGIRVETQGIPLMGGFSNKVRNKDLPPNAPVIRIRGIAIMGGVDVKTRS